MAKKFNFVNQLFLPEMYSFWLILIPLIVLNLIIFFQLTYIWGLIVSLISLIVIVLVFFSNSKAAKTKYRLLVERNQTQAIVANFTDPIIAYNIDFSVSAFNSAAEELFKVKKEEILGKKISPEWVKNKRLEILAKVVFPSLAPTITFKSDPDEYPQVIDITFPEPYLEFTVITVRVKDPKGNVLGFFKIVKDRTREEELLTSKSEFLTVAAHQLRTPLTAIRWTFESVIKGNFGAITENQREALQTGLIATEKVLNTANDLLETANIESGKFGYSFGLNNIVELSKKMIETYQPLADKHNIKIYLDTVKDNIPSFKFDILRINLVFQNLLENAIRYNVKNGEVVIKLEKKDSYLEISVRDTGIGIPEKEIPKIFTKFFRGSNVLKYETEGTGLGLFIVKNIVEAHGGKIWIESVEKRGSTFYFTLPLDETLLPKGKGIVE
jgi:signal transduction histidine kinase